MRRILRVDPRRGWALSLAAALCGFLLALPAGGILDLVAAALMIGGFLSAGLFMVLNDRRVPPERRSWNDWDGWQE